jgi:hypothetical protein
MKKSLPLFLFSFIVAIAVKAQVNYSFASSTATYTALSSGTSPTLTDDGQNPASDEGFASSLPIGFSFTFNGTAYTTFNVSTNGFITLGGTLSDAEFLNSLSAVTSRPIIAPLWDDLDLQDVTNLKYQLSGAAPNQVLTIEWSSAKWDYNGAAAAISFQAKLYQTTNVIEFLYKQETGATSNPSASIGIAGTKSGDFIAVSNTATINTVTEASITTKPATGTKYTFTPAAQAANDIGVAVVYAMGKLGAGTNNQVKAYVKNIGTSALTNVPFTLTVSGANTYTSTITIASIAAGARGTITFPAFSSANTGTNTLAVTCGLSTDQVAANNAASTTQEITSSEISYAVGTAASSSINAGASGLLAAKFPVPYSNKISAINLYFSTSSKTYDISIYDNVSGVPGTALWSSTGKTSTLGLNTITVPNIAVTDSFYVAVKQTGTSLTLSYQLENPLRSNAIFYKSSTGSWSDIGGDIYRLMIGVTFSSPLPVSITSFTGERRSDGNLLSWATATEANNKGFELQRSADGREFSTIAVIASKAVGGNSNTMLNYSYIDPKALKGNNYYRLVQTDKDGKTSVSTVVFIKALKTDRLEIVSVYPNPATTQLNLQLGAAKAGSVSFVVTDLSGKVVMQQMAQVAEGDNNLQLNISKLVAGNYFVKAVCADGCETNVQRFVKQ